MVTGQTDFTPQQKIARTSLLAVLYFVFGQLSFLAQVDNVLVTPVLFAPEGIALAFVLRYGAGLWPGVFVGQLVLALSRGLPLIPALGISAGNSLEAVLGVVLFRALKLDAGLPRARDLAGLLALVFFVLQPFSATLGNAILWWSGLITDPAGWPESLLNWWMGNSLGQMLVTPALLALLAGTRNRRQLAGDLIIPVAVLVPALIFTGMLLQQTGIASFVVIIVPILVALAVYRGLIAVCTGAVVIAATALYATGRNFGPFVHDGRVAILDLNVFLLGLALSGQFLAMFIRQLGRQREIEQELQATKEELKSAAYELTENIPVGTYTMVQPPDGGMAYFSFLSTRFLELTGLDRESAKANPMNAFACVHPDDHEEWVRKNAYVFEHKLPFREECRIVVRGETRWIRAESRPRDLADGSVVWEGVLTDITERKKAEQKLAQSEAQLQRILDNIPIPVAINRVEKNPRITFLNATFTQTFGYTLGDIPTVPEWAVLAYPDEEYRQTTLRTWETAVEKAAQINGAIEPMEFRVRCKDGTCRDVLINAVALEDMLLVGFVDITARKQNEERERQLETKYRRELEDKLKTSLEAATVAHEINQPLSAILLQSKMALQKNEYSREVLGVIAGEAQRVVVTIDKMKTLLRNVQTEHHIADLAAVVRSALFYNKGMLARHRITVSEEGLDDECPIMGDDAQLQLAMTNILRNAAEAIAEAKPKRREISIALAEHGNEVALTIGDSGPGWSGAELSETPLTTTKTGGTGIGLYVVRTTVRNHGGTITFGRSPLGGAEVRMVFPRMV